MSCVDDYQCRLPPLVARGVRYSISHIGPAEHHDNIDRLRPSRNSYMLTYTRLPVHNLKAGTLHNRLHMHTSSSELLGELASHGFSAPAILYRRWAPSAVFDNVVVVGLSRLTICAVGDGYLRRTEPYQSMEVYDCFGNHLLVKSCL